MGRRQIGLWMAKRKAIQEQMEREGRFTYTEEEWKVAARLRELKDRRNQKDKLKQKGKLDGSKG